MIYHIFNIFVIYLLFIHKTYTLYQSIQKYVQYAHQNKILDVLANFTCIFLNYLVNYVYEGFLPKPMLSLTCISTPVLTFDSMSEGAANIGGFFLFIR